MSSTITLVPVTGKFVSLTDPQTGKTHEVWRLNPATGRVGTPVEYESAVKLLCKQPPIVTLHEGVLREKDAAKVREAQLTGQSALPASLSNPAPAAPPSQTTEQLMEVIQRQAEQMNQFIQTVNSLTQTVADLKASGTGRGSSEAKQSPPKVKK